MKAITALVTALTLVGFAGSAFAACDSMARKNTSQTTAQNAPPLLPPQTPAEG